MLDADDDSFNRQTKRLPEVSIACEEAPSVAFFLHESTPCLLSSCKRPRGRSPRFNITIEILSDQMQVTLDGKPAGLLESPGIAHETKESFHLTVNGLGVLFDDVPIWTTK